MGLLEKLHRQDGGQAAENVKVVPLDHVSNRCRHDYASEVLWNLWAGHCCLLPNLTPSAARLARDGAATSKRASSFPNLNSPFLDRLELLNRPERLSSKRNGGHSPRLNRGLALLATYSSLGLECAPAIRLKFYERV